MSRSHALVLRLAAQCALLGLLASVGSGAIAQAAAGSNSVLLVDDDDSDNNSNPASGKLSASDTFYRALLAGRSLSYDTVVVPRYADGPTLDKLRAYSLVVWYTGASYGGNRDNTAVISLKDEGSLADYLQQAGGSVLLFSPGYLNNALGAGGAALWAKKESQFLQQVLGIRGGRGLLQRFSGGDVMGKGGGHYTIVRSATVETQFSAMNPDTAETLFTATLDPDGKGAQAVPVAIGHGVGGGRIVYVAFTFENIAGDAGAAFAELLPAAGRQVVGRAAPATAPPKGFTPGQARTGSLTLAGTGAVAAGPPFVAARARAATLALTGTGQVAAGAPFVAAQARTKGLLVTGTGSL